MDACVWDERAQVLLAKLAQRQQELGISHRAFASQLGVSHTLWTLTLRGKLPVWIAILRGAGGAFPDFRAESKALLRTALDRSNGCENDAPRRVRRSA